MTTFPERFLWGAATAAHQVEGNNINSDFWVMEHTPGDIFAEPSGDACDHYRLYRQDIGLLRELGFTSYRFTIEWARVEPEQGFVSKAALAHYRDVLKTCHEFGITPMVTLHHFTSPRWLMRLGGWESPEVPPLFARYSEVVARELGSLMPYVCTINEANIGAMIRQMMAAVASGEAAIPAPVGVGSESGTDPRVAWAQSVAQALNTTPDQVKPFLMATSPATQPLIMEAHQRARDVVKAVSPTSQVGITLTTNDIQALPGGEARAAAVLDEIFRSFLPACDGDDFLGMQNYSRQRVGPDSVLGNEEGVETTQMGYEFYPEALEGVIRLAAEAANKPIIVTENGVATGDDSRRVEFIRRALAGVGRCLADGIDVRSYYYWSLLDNFEWMLGYRPTFGLISVNRETQERQVKQSARYLGEIARTNGVGLGEPNRNGKA
jgi:beta-glucosidase